MAFASTFEFDGVERGFQAVSEAAENVRPALEIIGKILLSAGKSRE